MGKNTTATTLALAPGGVVWLQPALRVRPATPAQGLCLQPAAGVPTPELLGWGFGQHTT